MVLKERMNQCFSKGILHLSEFFQGALSHWTSHLCLGVRLGMGWQRPQEKTEYKENVKGIQAYLDPLNEEMPFRIYDREVGGILV